MQSANQSGGIQSARKEKLSIVIELKETGTQPNSAASINRSPGKASSDDESKDNETGERVNQDKNQIIEEESSDEEEVTSWEIYKSLLKNGPYIYCTLAISVLFFVISGV